MRGGPLRPRRPRPPRRRPRPAGVAETAPRWSARGRRSALLDLPGDTSAVRDTIGTRAREPCPWLGPARIERRAPPQEPCVAVRDLQGLPRPQEAGRSSLVAPTRARPGAAHVAGEHL